MYHCNRFELAIACRRELSVIGRNEGKLCADRISNDDRRGKMNGIKRSDVVVFDYLFCLGQDLRHRLHELPKKTILFHAGKNGCVNRSGDFALRMSPSYG